MNLDLSIIIPVYNEEKNIPELHKRLKKVLTNLKVDYEIIFVDDGSLDNTLKVIKKIRAKDNKVRIICFSRNFGHMPAINAGLKFASGKKVGVIDADLQDPPSILAKMYKKSIQGFDIVYGVKISREEGVLMRFAFSSFYKILDKLSPLKMPLDAGAFSILDRRIVNILIKLPERNKYFSGLRVWAGFKQTGVKYKRSARFKGRPATFKRLVKLALDGIVSFSFVPLRIASILGFVFATVSFLLIAGVLIARFAFGFGIIGWTSTMLSILLMGGVQLITLGIIGEYLARIYDEVKNRPEYIISEKIGFKKTKLFWPSKK